MSAIQKIIDNHPRLTSQDLLLIESAKTEISDLEKENKSLKEIAEFIEHYVEHHNMDTEYNKKITELNQILESK